ncbi:MAG: glycosyl hydrolase 108 family protein [Bacteroidota bacterium]|nr:glycosyl hydrolase 108 family protein [Bacteroidota bacterium]
MAEFKIALQKTLLHEGGYINDPDDLGGETYKGISRAAHSNWHGWEIIDNYKSKPGFLASLDKDVELQKEVEVFYWTNFWLPMKIYDVRNQTTANSLFDFAVNAGIQISVRLAQSIIGTIADGIFGEQTLAKINAFDPSHFQAAFTVAKIEHYISIIQKRPTNKKYLYGWIARALEYS